jgi:hypothetical protein
MVLDETGEVGANFETVTGEGTQAQKDNSAATAAMLTRGTAIAENADAPAQTQAQAGNSDIATKPNLPSDSSASSRKWTNRS